MKYLKIVFIFSVALSLSSFAYLSTDYLGKEELFKAFINEFKKVQLPNTLIFKSDHHRVNNHEVRQSEDLLQNSTIKKSANKPKNILGNDYVTFIPGINSSRMSRIGPSTYIAEVLLTSNKQYTAVIYSESRAFNYSSDSYTLATFDKDGKQINSKNIGDSNPNVQIKFRLTQNMEITIDEMSLNDDIVEYKAPIKWFITPAGKILIHNVKSGSNTKVKSI